LRLPFVLKAFICEDLLGLFNGDEIMGSSECEICGENDYLDEYSLDEMSKSIYVCRNCVEEGLKLRIKQMRGLLND
jgi:hypothetical protein